MIYHSYLLISIIALFFSSTCISIEPVKHYEIFIGEKLSIHISLQSNDHAKHMSNQRNITHIQTKLNQLYHRLSSTSKNSELLHVQSQYKNTAHLSPLLAESLHMLQTACTLIHNNCCTTPQCDAQLSFSVNKNELTLIKSPSDPLLTIDSHGQAPATTKLPHASHDNKETFTTRDTQQACEWNLPSLQSKRDGEGSNGFCRRRGRRKPLKIDHYIPSILMDFGIRYLYSKGYHHAIIRTGIITRILGNQLGKYHPIDLSNTAQNRVHLDSSLILNNASFALIDKQSHHTIHKDTKRMLIVSNSTINAYTLAHYIASMPPKRAFKILELMGKGIIIDKDDMQYRTSNFQ